MTRPGIALEWVLFETQDTFRTEELIPTKFQGARDEQVNLSGT
jgi:hypothetical protein